MSQVLKLESAEAAVPVRRAARSRYFYPAAALLVLALTFIGFHHFYLQGRSYPGREITPPIRSLIIAHAIAMSAWILLFAVQPMLIAARRVKLHMTLGIVGVGLALAVLPLGYFVAIHSARVTPESVKLWGLEPRAFLVVPLASLLVFGVCVGFAIWKRKRAEIHRPMMLVGTLSAAGAAVSRIDAISNLYLGTVFERLWGPFFATLVLGAILLAIKCALEKKFDKWMAIGLAAMAVVFALAMQVATTRAWAAFAALML